MPSRFEIMHAIKKGFNSLCSGEGTTAPTRSVKTELCRIGQSFDYKVYANRLRRDEVEVEVEVDGGEWLYDVIWLNITEAATAN